MELHILASFLGTYIQKQFEVGIHMAVVYA